jgi:hypothetical protein
MPLLNLGFRVSGSGPLRMPLLNLGFRVSGSEPLRMPLLNLGFRVSGSGPLRMPLLNLGCRVSGSGFCILPRWRRRRSSRGRGVLRCNTLITPKVALDDLVHGSLGLDQGLGFRV